jgi:hypothetical protein
MVKMMYKCKHNVIYIELYITYNVYGVNKFQMERARERELSLQEVRYIAILDD